MSSPVSILWWQKLFKRYGQGCLVFMTLILVVGFGWNQFGGGRPNDAQQANPDKVIMKVNGEPITQQRYAQILANQQMPPPGTQFAALQGNILQALVQEAIVSQMAQKRGIKVEAADVDRQVDTMRERANMKNSSDADWENFLGQRAGMSLSELRERLATSSDLLRPALIQSYKTAENVTDQEAKNQNAEVKLELILISVGNSRFMPPSRSGPPLTDPQAKAKAESLLAKARSGADFAQLARANSKDFSASKGGMMEFRPEYKGEGQLAAMMGVLGFGKDFDDAVHKTQTGQFTDLIKATGFQQGYVFAKVLDRRVNAPKDFDLRKAVDQIKSERATVKLDNDIQAQVKAAKVEVLDPDKKPYYDYAVLQKLQQPDMQSMMLGTPPPPTNPADIKQRQELADSEFEALLKRHPDDSTVAMMVADSLKSRKMYGVGVTAAQRAANQDRLISIYEKVLKTTEDRTIRFDLADLYSQKKDYVQADKQYAKIAKYLGEDPPYNSGTFQEYKGYYDKLATSFAAINQPAEAARMRELSAQMQQQAVAAQAKEAADAKAQQQQQAAQSIVPPATSTPGPSHAPVTPGGTKTAPKR